jgi:four helix bundle protein
MNADCGTRTAEFSEPKTRRKSVEELKKRTKAFSLAVIKIVETLPRDRAADVLARQLLRAATSVGANYRAACRARSSADFISKRGIVEEEADEAASWLELLIESGKLEPWAANPLIQESNGLTAIVVASINTTRRSGNRS